MSVSETGRELDPISQVLLLLQLNLELEAEVSYQNQLISCQTMEENMREIRDMASGMKDAVAKLRRDASAAKDGFQSEFTRAQANTQKFQAFTDELKDANKEVESFLGVTGSNFPTSEDSNTPHVEPGHADVNGVTLNPGAPAK